MEIEDFDALVPWFWIEEIKMREYSPSLSKKLEFCYQNYLKNKKLSFNITFSSSGQIYSIDFNRMTQMNTRTNKVRKITRGEINRLDLKEYNFDESIKDGYWFYYDEKKGLLVPFSPKSQRLIENGFLDKNIRSKGLKLKNEEMEFNFNKMTVTKAKKSSKLLRCNTKAVWVHLNEKDKWQTFPDGTSEQIEKAFLKKLPDVVIKEIKGNYETLHRIDFATMKKTEKNKNTFLVNVKRIAPIIPSGSSQMELQSISEMDLERIEEIKKDDKKKYISHVKEMLWTSQRNYKAKKKIFFFFFSVGQDVQIPTALT